MRNLLNKTGVFWNKIASFFKNVAEKIKNRIDEMAGAFLFTYNGRNCGVDPISRTHFEMWYGEEDMIAKSIDEVMTAPLFGGKCLNEIASDSTIECW